MYILKICNYCGEEYEVPVYQIQRSKFCSDKCFRASRNTQSQYNCDYCHKPFFVKKSKIDNIKNGITKYLCCSPDCAKSIQKPKWEDIRMVFEKRGYILNSKEYTNCKQKLEYICPRHIEKGAQFVTYNNIKNGYGCKYCGYESAAKSKRLSIDKVKEIFLNNDMELIDGQSYNNTSELMAYICIHHREQGIQYMTTSNAYKNHCPYCNKSKGEEKISKYLDKNNIKYIPQYRYENLLGLGGKRLSYDFYLPSFNLLIEYQGEFHNGSANAGLQTTEGLIKQKEHDRRKREYAKHNNIDLLEIWYYDFNKIENILSTILLNNK